MTRILVICSSESVQQGLPVAEAMALGARLAHDLDAELVSGVFGENTGAASELLSSLGARHVYAVSDARLAHYSGDLALAAAHKLVEAADADCVLVLSDADSIEWAPRLAARLKAALVSSCEAVRVQSGELIAERKISGGALKAELKPRTPVKIFLLTPGMDWGVATPGAACAIEDVALGDVETRIQFQDFVPDVNGEGPPLKSARVVVSGGLGIGSADKWALVEDAASAMGAAVGASRAAVEAGWVPSSRQVGFSGVKVGPELYIAAGISGALHHLAGIGRARKVVAINNDPDAPIFKFSHIAVIGDVNEILPAFAARVRELQE